jgi:3-phenylpropionate/trans-cinnamate dioxygenase ferredoxin subunit
MASIRVAATSDIPDGTGKKVEVEGRIVALFNVGGSFYALEDTCSHADASLGDGEVDMDDVVVECPLHGSLFDLATGKPRTLPAYEPVMTYTVRVEQDDIFIELES